MKRIFILFFAALLLCLPQIASAAGSDFSNRTRDMAEVTGVRIGDGADKTRIVIDADKSVSYKKMVLSSPDRVVIDVKNAWLSPKVKHKSAVNSKYVGKVTVAQFNKTTVRVVVTTKVGKGAYKVFSLGAGGKAKERIVLDFGTSKSVGKSATKTQTKKPKWKKPAQKTEPAKKDEGRTAEDIAIDQITGLKGKTITIDAGHGGSDPGAIGPTGVMEKSVTMRIATELKKILEKEGATVYMTRTKDTEVSSKGANATDIEELQARCDVANNKGSDIFVSIHMDSFSSGDAGGTTGYYYTDGSEKSKRLADRVRSGVIDQLGTQSRGTQSANFYVIRHTDMPATLVEVAFISNPREEELLDSKNGIKRAAQGIADGIADYFG